MPVSDTSITLDLHNRQQAWFVIREQLFPFVARWMQAGKQLVLTVSLRKRTQKQNKRYWGRGVLAQITEQVVVGAKMYSSESWHEQFKRQFIGVIDLPNGEVQGMSSTQLSTAEFCDFCTQVEAYATQELGVMFIDLEQMPDAKQK